MTARIEVIRSREALAAIVPAWEGLAANAIEANPFYEPWFLLPALRARRWGPRMPRGLAPRTPGRALSLRAGAALQGIAGHGADVVAA